MKGQSREKYARALPGFNASLLLLSRVLWPMDREWTGNARPPRRAAPVSQVSVDARRAGLHRQRTERDSDFTVFRACSAQCTRTAQYESSSARVPRSQPVSSDGCRLAVAFTWRTSVLTRAPPPPRRAARVSRASRCCHSTRTG